MDIYQAHSKFVLWRDKDALCSPDDGEWTEEFRAAWPSMMTAAAILSGQLEECKTSKDLERACLAFQDYLEIGTYTPKEWAQEAKKVSDKVDSWCHDFLMGKLN